MDNGTACIGSIRSLGTEGEACVSGAESSVTSAPAFSKAQTWTRWDARRTITTRVWGDLTGGILPGSCLMGSSTWGGLQRGSRCKLATASVGLVLPRGYIVFRPRIISIKSRERDHVPSSRARMGWAQAILADYLAIRTAMFGSPSFLLAISCCGSATASPFAT